MIRKKYWFIVLIILFLSVIAFFKASLCSGFDKLTTSTARRGLVRTSVGGKEVSVETAKTPQERERGLSDRKNLCPDCGLLFIFDQADIYPFWMKRMYFDIDILWISGDRVADITLRATKPSAGDFDNPKIIYQSKMPIAKVLEVNAGWVEKNGIKIGDKVISQ